MSVAFINALNVDPKDDAYFVEMWDEGALYVAKQPGFIATSLHKSHSQAASYQYFAVAVWESDQQFRAVTSTDWWKAYRKRFGFDDACRLHRRARPAGAVWLILSYFHGLVRAAVRACTLDTCSA